LGADRIAHLALKLGVTRNVRDAIDRVHTRRVNADENFTRLWLRMRRIFVLENLWPAVIVNSNRFHCASIFGAPQSAAHRALRKTMFFASA
jgi:hypothetical protein